VTIVRAGIDPRTGAMVRGTIRKTVYPPGMSPAEIDAAGEQALRQAGAGAPGSTFEPFGTHSRVDGSPADGYFEAVVPGLEGEPMRVQGWFAELPDGTLSITSHAPVFDKSWPPLPASEW
jgi:hypothetical protein